MWDLSAKNTSCGRNKQQKSLKDLDLQTIKLHFKRNINPPTMTELIWHEHQLHAHPELIAVISAAWSGSKGRVLHLLNVLCIASTSCVRKGMPHIAYSGHKWVLLWMEQLPGTGLAQRQLRAWMFSVANPDVICLKNSQELSSRVQSTNMGNCSSIVGGNATMPQTAIKNAENALVFFLPAYVQ